MLFVRDTIVIIFISASTLIDRRVSFAHGDITFYLCSASMPPSAISLSRFTSARGCVRCFNYIYSTKFRAHCWYSCFECDDGLASLETNLSLTDRLVSFFFSAIDNPTSFVAKLCAHTYIYLYDDSSNATSCILWRHCGRRWRQWTNDTVAVATKVDPNWTDGALPSPVGHIHLLSERGII